MKGLSLFHVGNPSGSARTSKTGSQTEHGDKKSHVRGKEKEIHKSKRHLSFPVVIIIIIIF